jgi:hypothetical protein
MSQSYNFNDGTFQGIAPVDPANIDVAVDASSGLNGSSYGVLYTVTADTANDAYLPIPLDIAYSDIDITLRFKIGTGSSMQFAPKYANLIRFAQSSEFNVRASLILYYSGGQWSLRSSVDSLTDYVNISENTEYLIKCRFKRDASVGGMQVWLNGILEIDDMDNALNDSDIGYISIGPISGNGNFASGSSFIVDEINIDIHSDADPVSISYPAKTVIVGGQGDHSGANDDNGGGYSSDSTYLTFQGANGGPLFTIVSGTYDSNTGKITKVASFDVGLEGVWVNTREGAAGAWVEKRYYIQASDADSITIGAGLGSNADIDVWVGGALKTIEEALAEAAEASGSFDSGYDVGFDIHYGAITIRIDYPDGSLELQNGDSVTLDVPSGGISSIFESGVLN